jgi:hypothetical protein
VQTLAFPDPDPGAARRFFDIVVIRQPAITPVDSSLPGFDHAKVDVAFAVKHLGNLASIAVDIVDPETDPVAALQKSSQCSAGLPSPGTLLHLWRVDTVKPDLSALAGAGNEDGVAVDDASDTAFAGLGFLSEVRIAGG